MAPTIQSLDNLVKQLRHDLITEEQIEQNYGTDCLRRVQETLQLQMYSHHYA